VEIAVSALTKALAGLEANPSNPVVDGGINKPVETIKPGDKTAGVKTGDNSLVGVFTGMAMLSIAGLGILRKKEY
jgi:LPXTG-motif cell wall-anchored protein